MLQTLLRSPANAPQSKEFHLFSMHPDRHSWKSSQTPESPQMCVPASPTSEENDIKEAYRLDREPQQQYKKLRTENLMITNNCITFQTLTQIFRINFLSFKVHKLNIFKFMLLNCIPWGHSSLLIKWGFVFVSVCTRASVRVSLASL